MRNVVFPEGTDEVPELSDAEKELKIRDCKLEYIMQYGRKHNTFVYKVFRVLFNIRHSRLEPAFIDTYRKEEISHWDLTGKSNPHPEFYVENSLSGNIGGSFNNSRWGSNQPVEGGDNIFGGNNTGFEPDSTDRMDFEPSGVPQLDGMISEEISSFRIPQLDGSASPGGWGSESTSNNDGGWGNNTNNDNANTWGKVCKITSSKLSFQEKSN